MIIVVTHMRAEDRVKAKCESKGCRLSTCCTIHAVVLGSIVLLLLLP